MPPLVCTPNAALCNGNVATTCNSCGTGYNAGGTDCAAQGKLCKNGVCAALTTVTINFDNISAPCVFASTSPLTTQYTAQGVTFAGPSGGKGGAVVNQCGNFSVSGHSAPNFLAFNAGVGWPVGPETLTFTNPSTSVSILAGYAGAGTITMTAYNTGGQQVASNSIAASSALKTLSVSASEIKTVKLSFTGSICVFDNLTFTKP